MQLPENRVVEAVTKKSVLIGLGVLVGALIVVDVFLATDEVGGNTWSELMRIAADKTPVVPWLCGLVMGHWFHPGEALDPLIDPPGNALALLLMSAIVLVIGYVVVLPPWLPLVIAAPIGALVWPVATNRERLTALGAS